MYKNRKNFLSMGRPKLNNVQVNISILMEWKKELENCARIYLLMKARLLHFLTLCEETFRKNISLKSRIMSEKNLTVLHIVNI